MNPLPMSLICYEIDPIGPDQLDVIVRLWELKLRDCWAVLALVMVAPEL